MNKCKLNRNRPLLDENGTDRSQTRSDNGGGGIGILLDAVGTLIEPVPSVGEVYLAAALRQGISLEREVVRNRFHRYFREDERNAKTNANVTNESLEKQRWERIVCSVLSEVPDPARAFEELWNHFAEPRHWRCFADVKPALASLQVRGYRLRVASNFDGRLRRIVAETADLQGLADALLISSELTFRKPDPRFYELACLDLGLPPSQVWSIGDDLVNDVDGPIRAGLSAIHLQRSGNAEPLSDNGVCRTLLDAVERLPRLT